MKTNFLFILLLFFLSLAMVSCVAKKPIEPVVVEHTKEITKIVKDTIFKVEADSSFYKAFVECRDGKPVIIRDSIIEKPGKNVLTPQVIFRDNYLNVNCKSEAQKLFKSWRETYVKEQKPVIVKSPVYVEKDLKWWQKTLMWIGGIFLILFIIGITLKFI